MLTYPQPDIPQPIPAVRAWLLENMPEFALPEYTIRRLAETPNSGLPCVRIPSGMRRKFRLFVRPADVVTFCKNQTI